MICKVQRSLTQAGSRMLIYSKDRREVFHEGPMAGDIDEMLGDDDKIFVEVRLIARGGWTIERRLAPSDWPAW